MRGTKKKFGGKALFVNFATTLLVCEVQNHWHAQHTYLLTLVPVYCCNAVTRVPNHCEIIGKTHCMVLKCMVTKNVCSIHVGLVSQVLNVLSLKWTGTCTSVILVYTLLTNFVQLVQNFRSGYHIIMTAKTQDSMSAARKTTLFYGISTAHKHMNIFISWMKWIRSKNLPACWMFRGYV